MFLAPLRLVKLWDGGMSFHGGALGVSLGIVLFARRHRLDWLQLHDYVACCVPFGLFFGRVANFVNGELWGRPTNLPWAIVFPGARDGIGRHPSQFYEAALEGLALALLLAFLFWRTRARHMPGLLVGAFLIGNGLAQFAALRSKIGYSTLKRRSQKQLFVPAERSRTRSSRTDVAINRPNMFFKHVTGTKPATPLILHCQRQRPGHPLRGPALLRILSPLGFRGGYASCLFNRGGDAGRDTGRGGSRERS